jgi:16S rRNA (guanine527-N7)-methyltransferase
VSGSTTVAAPGGFTVVPTPATILDVLAEARAAGFLGPGPVEAHLGHAEGFVSVAHRLTPLGASPLILDLGSGGGLPGLVLAAAWTEATLVLLEANGRRAEFLRRAVRRLALHDRVSVLQERAEAAGRDARHRAAFDGVLARSFGRPAVVAECGAPLLRVGGWLVVSEPPPTAGSTKVDSEEVRWPAEALEQFGLEPAGVFRDGATYQALRQAEICPDRFPRRDGVPARKPLF